MRIVIDLQGGQTESRFRGIGRYTMSFAKAVVRNRGEHEIILVVSGLFPDTIEAIRAAFDGLLPQENIRVWYAPGPVKEEQPGNDRRREVAEFLREACLASLQPDVIHICSLFEGYVDDGVTSIGRFDKTTAVSVTLYDLIPLLNPDHYLKPKPRYEQYYLRKIESLKKAELFLAISEYSRKEAVSALGLPDGKAICVPTAIDSFAPQVISEETARRIRSRFSITHPFVLYIGGVDERKNLPRLIQAYAALPKKLRENHQLVFAGKMPEGYMARFKHLAQSAGLKANELVFTGYINDEELIQLYNLCQLYIFPSWHEGFGLPALEAMACGAPVIGANTTSLPEVIGLDEALFDPFDVGAITAKLSKALQDEAFRRCLREHGLQQAKKFSWDETARRAISAWESMQITLPERQRTLPAGRKPRLAFISPMPPQRTGIADYSAELLPALSHFYHIELVVAQDAVDEQRIGGYAQVRDVAWFRAHAAEIDRVLYHMGNSPYHQHMLSLMEEIPGVVVLHDFYLGHLMAWMELHGGAGHIWARALYDTHGYGAVQARYQDTEAAKRHFPVNGHVMQHALGIIVHSEHSRQLARQWYGECWGNNWRVIPPVRVPAQGVDRLRAREQLGFDERDVLVCSFGFLGESKLNHRLVQAWLMSALAADTHCHLVFVGENHGGNYGADVVKRIKESGLERRIRITGYAAPALFEQYLAAADIAVQLRTQSRGETSRTVLDCMNYGLPTIVNDHGSMAELDDDAVWMLPDEFDDAMLVDALEQLWRSPEKRRQLGEQARKRILEHHAPDMCALKYAEAIEEFYSRNVNTLPTLIQTLAKETSLHPLDSDLIQLASALSRNHPLPRVSKRLYLDLTATIRNDLKTGIERVARALTMALLASRPAGYRIEPVYLSHENERWVYRHGRRYTFGLLGCPSDGFEDDIIEPQNGDILLGLDISGDSLIQAERSGLFKDLRNQGVSAFFIVHDLLPIVMPGVFPPNAYQIHENWLRAVSRLDGAVCVSRSVAEDLAQWQRQVGINSDMKRKFTIGWFHLGADILCSAPSRGLPPDASKILKELKARPTFLMVGTIEPRKGYLQTMEAFTQLWREGVDVNLVIVGKEGWKDLPHEMRRDIPQTVERLRNHPELNKRLFWLEGISDEYLEKVYAASTCLIAASYGEGFGLPLIEAARHKLPIIARDIPVFREVAGEHAYYFEDKNTPEVIADAVRKWLILYQKGMHPTSENMPWLTWKESAENLLDIILRDKWAFSILPDCTIKPDVVCSHTLV